jgi:hypothetical protein
MSSKRIARVICALALTAAAHVLAAPAQAAGPAVNDVYSCQIDGMTTSLTPIPTVGGSSGSYTLADPAATCAQVDIDGAAGLDASGNNTAVFTADFASAGTYNSITCGTGAFTGNPGGTTLRGSGEGDLSVNYTILLVGMNGTMAVTGGTDGDGEGDKLKGGGVVNIRPTNVTTPNDFGCVTAPASGFRVTGAIAIEANPVG